MTTDVEIAEQVATNISNIKHLQEYEAKQNGSLQRMEGRLDKLEDKLDSIKMWIIGSMLTIILFLAGLLLKGVS